MRGSRAKPHRRLAQTLGQFEGRAWRLSHPLVGAYRLAAKIAHDRQRKRSGNYDAAYEAAAEQAEQLLAFGGRQLAPKLLDSYAAVIWEDQDECLEVRPEDVRT